MAIAAREAERLRVTLGSVLVEVHHVRSTAIPSIRAKPIVDLLPVVRSLVEIDALRAKVEALGLGRLSAVIDFGCCGVGDPAFDLAIAWDLLGGESRETFRAALPLDRATWARGRGWALWKALITRVAHRNDSLEAPPARMIIDDELADHRRKA